MSDAAARREQLETRRADLKENRSRRENLAPVLLGMGALLVLAAPVLPLATGEGRAFTYYLLFYGLALSFASVILRQRIRSLSEEITDLDNELDLLDLLGDDREYRATKLLQVNQIDLRRYYDQTLRQGNQIFHVGVLCIVVGFAIVGVSFWLVQSEELKDLSDKIVVAALGAIGGFLANFIAVIYLRMFSKTIESVGTFHRRLALRDRLNFGNILAARIAEDDLRDETLSEMAMELSSPGGAQAGTEFADDARAEAA